jgi:hypothetical protein
MGCDFDDHGGRIAAGLPGGRQLTKLRPAIGSQVNELQCAIMQLLLNSAAARRMAAQHAAGIRERCRNTMIPSESLKSEDGGGCADVPAREAVQGWLPSSSVSQPSRDRGLSFARRYSKMRRSRAAFLRTKFRSRSGKAHCFIGADSAWKDHSLQSWLITS